MGGNTFHGVLYITLDRQGHMEGGLHDWTKMGWIVMQLLREFQE